ncbi:MAG: hypothetical protein MH137_09480 [Flavobacteriales bacterium]|nr:hypothetical protein [Flavobacteriales bacterium]
MMKKTAYIIAALFFSASAFAQGVGGDVIVTGGFVPEIKPSEKLLRNPEEKDTFQTRANPVINVNPREIAFYHNPDTISAARMKSEPLKKLRRLYMKLGFGNYLTPLAQVRVNSLRSKNDAYDVGYSYFASFGKQKDVGFPGMQQHKADGNYKHLFNKHALSLKGGYTYDQNHYYGFRPDSLTDTLFPDKKSIRQHFHKAGLELTFANHDLTSKTEWISQTRMGYYFLQDRQKSREHAFWAGTDVSKHVKDFFVGGRIGVEYYNFKPGTATSGRGMGFIKFNPYIKAGREKWNVEVGFEVAGAFDTIAKGYIMPVVEGQANLYKNHVMAYIQAKGGVERNTFDRLRLVNPFIISNPMLGQTYTPIDARGGFKGYFAKNVYYTLGGGYRMTKNQVFFITDTLQPVGNFFKTVYDDMNTPFVSGEIGYAMGEKLHVALKGNYWFYKPQTFARAWHMPKIDLTLSASYNIQDKFLFKADFYYLGEHYSPFRYDETLRKPVAGVTLIRNAFDLNLHAEYRFNKMLSFWAGFNNFAAFRYNRWFRYPMQGFNGMGGITLSF